jgi:hypothetical protein
MKIFLIPVAALLACFPFSALANTFNATVNDGAVVDGAVADTTVLESSAACEASTTDSLEYSFTLNAVQSIGKKENTLGVNFPSFKPKTYNPFKLVSEGNAIFKLEKGALTYNDNFCGIVALDSGIFGNFGGSGGRNLSILCEVPTPETGGVTPVTGTNMGIPQHVPIWQIHSGLVAPFQRGRSGIK